MSARRPSAAILVIGDEVLRGETLDSNSHYLCQRLIARGIDVQRIVTVPDESELISDEIAALSRNFDFLITSGGIGPTPDDLTRAAVAAALGVPLELYPDCVSQLTLRLGRRPSEGQLAMCTWPAGAEVLWTELGGPAGCAVGNVLVLPGVPGVLKAVFAQVEERYNGEIEHTQCFETKARESEFAALMQQFCALYPGLKFGSYPTRLERGWRVEIRVRGFEQTEVEAVASLFRTALTELEGSLS